MNRPESVRCENCIFYAPSNTTGYTACHRYPKEVGCGTYHWCGEFQSKDNLTAIEWITWIKGLDIDGQVQK
jgi:hypothetical protein